MQTIGARLAGLMFAALFVSGCGSTFDGDDYREKHPPAPAPGCGLQIGSPCCYEGPNRFTCVEGLLCNRDKMCGPPPDMSPEPDSGTDAAMMSTPDLRMAPDLSVCSPPGGACILDTDCCVNMGWVGKCGLKEAGRCCRYPASSPQSIQCG